MRARAAAAWLAAVLLAAGCAGRSPEPSSPPSGPPAGEGKLVTRADVVSALLALPDGGLLYAERNTGRVRRLDARGRARGGVVARVAVRADGQRGLLGLARDSAGRLYAAWTDPSARLLVARLRPSRRVIWRGPLTSPLGVGGRLALGPDGRLVLGVGDLQARARIRDPAAPNGKLLSLDPDGRPGEAPRVLSSGWTNPFAFAFTPSGRLWVADNAVGRAPERLALGDLGGRPATRFTALPRGTAPSGLAAESERELVVCGYRSRALLRYRIGGDGRPRRVGEPVARDCALGVARLADGRLAYARPGSVVTVPAR